MRKAMRVVSAMAENAAPHLRAIADWVAGATKLPVRYDAHSPWPQSEAALYDGAAAFGFICGLPYVLESTRVEALVAPVMAGGRYGDRPVYFSDVVVRADSCAERFGDLRGRSFAFNEPGSHSGYNLVRYHLATLGEDGRFFGRVSASGAHQQSLRMVISGQIDCAAIDTIVLEQELANSPELAGRFKVVATLGPSPIQPFVSSRSVPAAARRDVAAALARMHLDSAGRQILERARIRRFEAATDAHYDEIRRMSRLAARVTLDHPPARLASPSCIRSLEALAS
jgi:phosphonate transport system substrate-binding protein